ncbi:hypothetical protein BW723_09720 [Polaribacter reichenbachii]|uniref:Polysaccharide polymerase n=1 Tax=Polaribacter reichenbachii TaxID=996801 RepID=A0A1B8U3G2_9FLAO|nr:hypothetical protein [Polaribacter reichenbachii]APZ46548.1 hypothetical protein BW723_09720 [Polaribacter reichenbachii]AUC17195.1 hypothetical protein BTO17_00170 [Polaribacter reichenbachii]OBY66372.1 hypothetical protein LPB301_06685 [Polaribacter reichenbachii]
MKKFYSPKTNSIIILVFFVLMENIFYLIDKDTFQILPGISYLDTYLIFFLYFCFRSIKAINKNIKYRFGWLVFGLLIFIIISAIKANLNSGQSILLGIGSQRDYFFILLSYYPINTLFKRNKINIKTLKKGFLFIGVLAGLIYFFQQVVYEQIIFVFVHSNYRYGSIRLYFDSALILISLFIALDYLFKKWKMKYLVVIIIGFLYELFVSKGRLELLAVITTIFIAYNLRSLSFNTRIFGAFFISILMYFFINSIYFDAFFDNGGSVVNNTTEIRNKGRSLYLLGLLSSITNFIFGWGYPHISNAKAMQASGADKNMFLVDNGLFGFFFVYGALGLSLILSVYYKLLKFSIKIRKKVNDQFHLYLVIFIIFLSYNIIFWWWKPAWTLLLVILMSYVELMYERYAINKNRIM